MQIVLLARFEDRIGKGVRTSPRDHLISLSVDEKYQDKAFGFHRTMDATRAIFGAFMALIVLVVISNNPEVFRIAFLLSFLHAIIAVGILFFLKEKPKSKTRQKLEKPKISLQKNSKYLC